MYTVLKYIQPLEGNREADVAPGENEFHNPAIEDTFKADLFKKSRRT